MAMAQTQKSPQPWHKIYNGDDECRFFKAIARGTHEWRTIEGLAKAASLKESRVEEMCNKYLASGIIEQSQKDPTKFRYWERSQAGKKPAKKSIAQTGQEVRIGQKTGSTKTANASGSLKAGSAKAATPTATKAAGCNKAGCGSGSSCP